MKNLRLDGRSLRLVDLAPLVRGEAVELELAAEARYAVTRARAVVERHVEARDVVYGLTTGFGKLKDIAIPREKLAELQENLILSHCCGLGEPMPAEEVRVAQVLRIHGLARGHSGVRLELLETLVRLFNQGLVPEVPRKGSVGASGDLAPLAHMAATLLGLGFVHLGGRRMAAADALRELGQAPLVLAAKEGLALINGTEVMKGIGVVVRERAAVLSRSADAVTALTLEALCGSAKPFDARLAELKGDPGHARTSSNVRACLAESGVLASHADCSRVQDPYSLRCAPIVHGAFKNALEHASEVLAREINAVTDNPVLFPDTGEVVSAGLFHGQPIAMALDYLALGLTTLANISERRIEQMVNPDLSGLPAFLARDPGLHSGLMIAQVAAAALASENKSLVHPASADTIPTSANQEDHVSMGVTAGRKAREILENAERVVAIEWLAAAAARDFRPELRAGAGAQAAHALLRTKVLPLARDRQLSGDIEAAAELIRSGALLAAVERVTGPLEA